MTAPTWVPSAVSQAQVRMASIQARLSGAPSSGAAATGATGAAFARALLGAGGLGSSTSAGGSGFDAGDLRQRVQQYVGIPYVWGGTDPQTGLDCSGFTQHLFRGLGIELPRVSADQLRTGAPVPDLASARPGDLLGWDTGPRNDGVDHVAVYLGGGMMAEAPGTGGHVQVVPVSRTPDAIRRVVGGSSLAPAGGAGALDAGTPFAAELTAAANRAGIDPRLLALVAERESGFDPTARSSAGAQGLMQLMPATARGLGVDPMDPTQAIDGAARLLRGHLDAFGSVEEALAAYNAGSGNVRRYGGVPPFAETQRYVQWITARYAGTGRAA